MKNQKRTIIGACDYTIATMKNLKEDLCDISAENPELNWGIGGVVATLTSNLIQICDQVFQESVINRPPSAHQDMIKIKEQFGQFIDRMVNNEK